jgi:pilus assembly protein CpaB
MRKSTLALAFAVILAVLAVVAVRRYLQGQKEDIQKAERKVDIWVADEAIPSGTPLERRMVRTHAIPEDCLLPQMVTPSKSDLVLRKKSKTDILRDHIILLDQFTEEAPRARVTIPPGRRIATVGVNSVTGISGLISPGDYVDVIWTNRSASKEGAGGRESALTIFNAVQVFAVDDIITVGYMQEMRGRSGRGPTPYTTVTLVLYPLECEILVFALSQGEITLVKRAPTDPGAPLSPGVDQSQVDKLLEQARKNRQEGGTK